MRSIGSEANDSTPSAIDIWSVANASAGRVACAIAAAVTLAAGFDASLLNWQTGIGLGALLAVMFLVCVSWHRRNRAAATRAATLARLNRQAAAKVRREWNEFPSP